ncbi:MarR family winged helix-turn-helix transcriptional regulator [Salipiger abyssi]|uniref:MarR family winged helix-turn-helix transcriptional regulator n=1 Tax=Salipiger abyssi TaxID=1250539 RepID=UPI001A8E2212|nr:MarR family transcriptional regulator [Salipiger abyssi]MBN9889217.1 MarR family transcriptional regulator [Salipiger abyssi]
MDQVDKIKAQWNRERPDLDVGPMGTIGRLGRLARHLAQAHAECFATHGLSPAGFDVLATLRRAGPPHALTVKDLLATTMVTSGTMTNRLDRLEAAGQVRRVPNPEDGRGFVVQLTERGRADIDAAVTDHVANQHRLVAALNNEERAALDALLGTWLTVFEGSDG